MIQNQNPFSLDQQDFFLTLSVSQYELENKDDQISQRKYKTLQKKRKRPRHPKQIARKSIRHKRHLQKLNLKKTQSRQLSKEKKEKTLRRKQSLESKYFYVDEMI